MGKKGLVSIIIPVYNTDPILMQDCLDSVLKQTYKDIEVILVNDGSTDKQTIRFLWTVKKESKKIIVLNKANAGVSSARNAGLNEARGEFVYFLDSDDYIDGHTIGSLVEKANKYGFIEVISRKKPVNSNKKTFGSLQDKTIDVDIDFSTIIANTISFTSQGALINSKVAKRFKFDEKVKYGEDFQYNFKVLNCGKAYYTNGCNYYYVQNMESALNSISYKEADKYLADFCFVYREVLDLCPKKEKEIAYVIYDKIGHVLKRCCMSQKMKYLDYRNLVKKYRKQLRLNASPKMIAGFGRNALVFFLHKRMYFAHYVVTLFRCRSGFKVKEISK